MFKERIYPCVDILHARKGIVQIVVIVIVVTERSLVIDININ